MKKEFETLNISVFVISDTRDERSEIPGFGEIFRSISFNKIGTSSLQSRALGGLAKNKFIFALPGSPNACKDAWDEILKYQLDSRTKPCNLVELFPRLKEK